ncbi:M20/M25/M40 family metallo-hydrolase [Nubsella zeaxanthinifaciens]|jgi:Zn-dependent M28 family amino/carboxypeptidase|uniref:M20/M25/M40 family metallo-hydrolase n=1 Tax=Nubsella zeaxanthinifaciens TaxID=392412 RepID=UPI000DE4DA46|nr:M20/M25/M40 family metallo-hydrolase [Nubsella zeaxanthinifaciens]
MKRLLLILPLAIQLGCGSVKEAKTANTQLLKDVEILSSDEYEGRKSGTKGSELSRAYLVKRLKEIGVAAHPSLGAYEQNFEIKGRNSVTKGVNLIAYVKGKSDDVIVVSAHYDHVGIIKDEVYNGADDNASGVGALLSYAKYFKDHQPNNTIIFALFDAEEMGLQGAKAFVANPPVALDKIKLNINMDMISHNDKGELYVVGTFKYPQLKQYITTTNPNIKLLLGHDDPKLGHDDWTNQSDQGAFNAKNIPFLYFGVEDHKDYHKATDEFKNINQTFYTNAVGAIQEVIINIDKQRDIQSIFKENLQMKKQ